MNILDRFVGRWLRRGGDGKPVVPVHKAEGVREATKPADVPVRVLGRHRGGNRHAVAKRYSTRSIPGHERAVRVGA